jgi:hypothetical protein
MSDRGPDGQDKAVPSEPPGEADLAIILGGDPDAVTTKSHDIIKAGFDASLADDADDVELVPAEPIASPRVDPDEHVVPFARRRWWFSRHHHRETDQGRVDSGRGETPESAAPSSRAQAQASPERSAPDPLGWLDSEPVARPNPAETPSDASATAAEPGAPDAVPETRASLRAKRRGEADGR